jgi:hypothetical protein
MPTLYLDVRVLSLDDGIKVAQAVAHFDGKIGAGEIVQNRLIIFIDEDDGALAKACFRRLDQGNETVWNPAFAACAPQTALIFSQDIADALIQSHPAFHDAFGEAQANHRIFRLPIPLIMTIQPSE